MSDRAAQDQWAIGLDVGGTSIRVGAVDIHGTVLWRAREPVVDRSVAAVVSTLTNAVAAVEQALGPSPTPAVGLALAAQTTLDGVVRIAPNLGWADVDVRTLLSVATGRPVRVLNDLAAAAVGEARVGAARGHADAVLFFVGSGIGSGLVLGGRLHAGAWGVSGEVGHLRVAGPDGLPCGCGARGCLEAYVGGHALLRRARAASAEHVSSVSDLEALAVGGASWARALIDEAAERLGDAASMLVTVLNPSVLVLGGGVLGGSPSIRAALEDRLDRQATRCARDGLRVVDAALGDDSGMIGAAFIAMDPEGPPPTG